MTIGGHTQTLSVDRSDHYKAKALNPVWDAVVQFQVPDSENIKIHIEIHDTDDFGNKFLIGETWIPLEGIYQDQEKVFSN